MPAPAAAAPTARAAAAAATTAAVSRLPPPPAGGRLLVAAGARRVRPRRGRRVCPPPPRLAWCWQARRSRGAWQPPRGTGPFVAGPARSTAATGRGRPPILPVAVAVLSSSSVLLALAVRGLRGALWRGCGPPPAPRAAPPPSFAARGCAAAATWLRSSLSSLSAPGLACRGVCPAAAPAVPQGRGGLLRASVAVWPRALLAAAPWQLCSSSLGCCAHRRSSARLPSPASRWCWLRGWPSSPLWARQIACVQAPRQLRGSVRLRHRRLGRLLAGPLQRAAAGVAAGAATLAGFPPLRRTSRCHFACIGRYPPRFQLPLLRGQVGRPPGRLPRQLANCCPSRCSAPRRARCGPPPRRCGCGPLPPPLGAGHFRVAAGVQPRRRRLSRAGRGALRAAGCCARLCFAPSVREGLGRQRRVRLCGWPGLAALAGLVGLPVLPLLLRRWARWRPWRQRARPGAPRHIPGGCRWRLLLLGRRLLCLLLLLLQLCLLLGPALHL